MDCQETQVIVMIYFNWEIPVFHSHPSLKDELQNLAPFSASVGCSSHGTRMAQKANGYSSCPIQGASSGKRNFLLKRTA